MKTLDGTDPDVASGVVDRTTPPVAQASPFPSVGRRNCTPASDPDPCRHFVGLVGQLWRLFSDLGLLLFVYLIALGVGILIDQSGEVARHYQMRGTLFPVENGQTQYPVLFPGR